MDWDTIIGGIGMILLYGILISLLYITPNNVSSYSILGCIFGMCLVDHYQIDIMFCTC